MSSVVPIVTGEEWVLLLELAVEARRALRTPAARRTEGRAPLRASLERVRARLSHPLAREVYAALIDRAATAPLTLAQVGQSLDGRIATESGHSHYINGPAALDHLHRLRALADAVVVGATTVVLDDPRLTTRRIEGPSPVRVILDPRGRVPAHLRVFDGSAPTLVLRAASAGIAAACAPAETVFLDAPGGAFPPAAILRALHARGLFTVLIEGGGATVSAFLREGLVQRLHVMAAPLLIGPGRTAFHLPARERLDGAPRFRMAAYPLGADVLLDCDLESGEGHCDLESGEGG